MNVNDSEKIRHILEIRGLVRAERESDADVVVVNTCAVRQKPQEKIYSYIGRLPPGKKIVIAGCVAQLEREGIIRRNPRVAFVVGTHQFQHLDRLLADTAFQPEKRVTAAFSREWHELVPAAACRESPVSAYISIMEGCDNFCSYCIVPHVRGREKHRPFGPILAEAEYLARSGFREISLLGQNVNHWRDDKAGMTFAQLLDRLAERVPVRWIRFVTSYPGYHDNELIAVMARHERLARHVHFPAQTGSTRILKRMARSYSRSDYLAAVAAFRKKIPAMAFSSDFIVGFPGETERDFRLTLTLLEQVEYESIFSFVYSPRPWTKALGFADDTPAAEKKERLHRLQEVQEKIQLRNNRKRIGRILEVLVSEPHPKKGGEMIGRSETHRVVNFASRTPVGEFTRVKITAAGPHSLRGTEVAE